jgi:hypothetical protein
MKKKTRKREPSASRLAEAFVKYEFGDWGTFGGNSAHALHDKLEEVVKTKRDLRIFIKNYCKGMGKAIRKNWVWTEE